MPSRPRQNRVTPTGELIAVPDRGMFFGNRGCLLGSGGELRRFFQVRRWIICVVEFKGRRRHPLMQPGRYTELFFLDEATALAAGHRPCAECQRARYDEFRSAWAAGRGDDRLPSAVTLDDALHAERWSGSGRRYAEMAADKLPPGAMFVAGDQVHLVVDGGCRAWTPGGYDESRPLPAGEVTLLTPPSTVDAIRRGYSPVLHPSAGSN
jgi:hypothetical protein